MGKRGGVGVLVAMLAIAAGAWFAFGPFTGSSVVTVTTPAISIRPDRGPVGTAEVWVRCAPGGRDGYTGADGGPYFTNGTEPTPPPASEVCDELRPDRRATGAGVALAGVAVGVALVALDRGGHHRQVDRGVEVLARRYADAGSTGTTDAADRSGADGRDDGGGTRR